MHVPQGVNRVNGTLPLISTSLWLGILVALSPCPLATNILAVTYLGRGGSDRTTVIYKGMFYALGRALVYLFLGYILGAGVLSIPQLARFLQKDFNRILGFILIFAGAGMLGAFRLSLPFISPDQTWGEKLSGMGLLGCTVLGSIFALSFCPVSAAIFFGSLVPLSIKYHAVFSGPLLFSIGSSLPVMILAFILSWGVEYVSKVYERILQVEKWIRRFTGVLFILAGIYFILEYF